MAMELVQKENWVSSVRVYQLHRLEDSQQWKGWPCTLLSEGEWKPV